MVVRLCSFPRAISSCFVAPLASYREKKWMPFCLGFCQFLQGLVCAGKKKRLVSAHSSREQALPPPPAETKRRNKERRCVFETRIFSLSLSVRVRRSRAQKNAFVFKLDIHVTKKRSRERERERERCFHPPARYLLRNFNISAPLI